VQREADGELEALVRAVRLLEPHVEAVEVWRRHVGIDVEHHR
jgi:hypothetical protein